MRQQATDPLDTIRQAYARRTRRYRPTDPAVYMSAQELERSMIRCFGRCGLHDLSAIKLLEVGCGSGKNLLRFLQLGFRADNLIGNDLIEERIMAAREVLPPQVTLLTGDAAQLALAQRSVDVVFQSMMCSSILDEALLSRACEKMWELVRPGGGVLWYDFVVDNPANPDVRGISRRRLARLFPVRPRIVQRVTLAPPLSRLVTRAHPALYGAFNLLPCLRTHVLAWIPKPRRDDAD